MKRWKLLVLPLVAGLAAACGLFSGEHEAEEASEGEEGEEGRLHLSEEAEEALRLEFATAEVREIHPTLVLSAELVADPDRHAEIGSPVEGRVVEVKVNVGDRVDRNAALAVIDSPEAGSARADFLRARAALEVARLSNERESRLVEDRATSVREARQAEADLRVAQADLDAAKARLDALGLPTADEASGRVVLRSPIAGEVTRRDAHIGQNVSRDHDLLEVMDLDRVWLVAGVYERQIGAVGAGRPVEVELRAYPGEVFTGTVATVGSALDDETRTAPVRVVLENPDRRLKPGMFATARVSGASDTEAKRALVVPWAAVQEVEGHPAVFVEVEEGEFELREVRHGDRAGEDVEVLDGLREDERVVAAGAFSLKAELLKSTLEEEEE
jgi:cobalt-zinc-cadmium efflux system membrane fusion protein